MSYNKKKIKSDIGIFLKQYKRKSSKSYPNDRGYDRKLEQKIKKMKPEELYTLIDDDQNT